MHDEEQQLQIQQEPLDPQLLSRVKQIIARKNTEFILDHQNDSLEQLSAYLKACMDDIGHPPARVEVIGGDFLEYRFESWPKALRSFKGRMQPVPRRYGHERQAVPRSRQPGAA